MKRIIWLVSCLLILCLALPVAGVAVTQDEWDLSCKKKTSQEADVYDYSGDKPGAKLDTLPKGTYVKVEGAKSDHWICLNYVKNGEEKKGWAQVEVEDCVSKIKKSDGHLYDVHEKDPAYAQKIAEGTMVFDVKVYSDYAAYISYANGLGPEPPRKDGMASDTSTYGDGEEAPKSTAAAKTTETSAKTKPADEPVEDITAEPADDTEDDVTATASVEPESVDLTGDVQIVVLGTYQSKVKVGKQQQVVLTSDLTFSADVPADQQLAVVYAPRSGSATIRKKASSNSSTVKKVEAGTVVSVQEVGEEFSKVKSGKKEGFILNKSLKFYAPATEIEGMGQLSKKGKTDGKSAINIRSDADKDSSKVDSWKTGTEIVIFSHSDGWYEVEANGKRGFVMEEFVTLSE